MKLWGNLINDFISLFYPQLCLSCGKNIAAREEAICISCQYHLPKTKFHLEKENTFTDRFWGRIPLESGTAFYHFSKGGKIQQLIHNLKYKRKQEIGVRLGRLYGFILKDSPHYQKVELIIPVPLHPKKALKRGYNQSALFAKGLSESMEIPWNGDVLLRTKMTETQTKKSRLERLENVKGVFALRKRELLKNKHVLIVDDVLTTGATLEACALKVQEVPNVKVSFATIAIAET